MDNYVASITYVWFHPCQGNWESLCDIRPDCHHHFDANELAERCLMSPSEGMKDTHVSLATYFIKAAQFFYPGKIVHEFAHI